MELQVEDRKPVARPNKTWSKAVGEDMKEDMEGELYHVRPQGWETRYVKQR